MYLCIYIYKYVYIDVYICKKIDKIGRYIDSFSLFIYHIYCFRFF